MKDKPLARARRHSIKESRHVRLYHWLMNTAAWKSLNAIERAVYIEMASLYGGVGSNNGHIGYSVRKASESLRIGKTTASRALERLQERGFIVATRKGAFSRKVRHATEWRLTEFPCDITHEMASKEFARWEPENKNTVPSQTRLVPEAGLIGTSRRTEHSQNSPIGT